MRRRFDSCQGYKWYNNRMDKKITCTQLWKKWVIENPNLHLVSEAQLSVEKYSKEDWDLMINDARQVIFDLSELVKNNIPIDDERSKIAFLKLSSHMGDYFFELTKDFGYASGFKIIDDPDTKKFFDQFYDGLSYKVAELFFEYSHLMK
jgi:hypothetical protein